MAEYIWILTAVSVVPQKDFILRCGLIHLKKIFDARFCTAKLCPSEDAQTKIDGRRVEGKHLPFYLKVFVDSLSSRNVYHMVGKLFENTRFSTFVEFFRCSSNDWFAFELQK